MQLINFLELLLRDFLLFRILGFCLDKFRRFLSYLLLEGLQLLTVYDRLRLVYAVRFTLLDKLQKMLLVAFELLNLQDLHLELILKLCLDLIHFCFELSCNNFSLTYLFVVLFPFSQGLNFRRIESCLKFVDELFVVVLKFKTLLLVV